MNERQRREAAEMTLWPYFERIHAPTFLSGAKPKTLKRNRESLDHWERETANPRLCEIDSETLSIFKSRLFNPASFSKKAGHGSPQKLLFEIAPEPEGKEEERKKRPLARATVNVHLRQIRTMFNKAGPPGPKNRDALGILKVVPWTKPLKEYKRKPRNVKDDLLAAIYRATSAATFPKLYGVSPEHWWKALIVMAVTVGYRKGGMLDLPWTGVDWEESLIRLNAEGDKCWTEREKPISKLVLQHLLRIRTSNELIFHFPASESTFYREWHRIQTAAGLPKERWIKLHDLKRACGTRFAKIASPWVVQKRLDHSSINTAQFYINATDEEREAKESQTKGTATMAGGGNRKTPLTQTALPFAEGEASHAERWNDLVIALHRIGRQCDCEMATFMRWVFNTTAGGTAGSLTKSYAKLAKGLWAAAIDWRRYLIAKACRKRQVSPEDVMRLLLYFAASQNWHRGGNFGYSMSQQRLGLREDVLGDQLKAPRRGGDPDLLAALGGFVIFRRPCLSRGLASMRILNLAVAPQARRRGIGRKLVRCVDNRAGIVAVVVERNIEAQLFFRSLGFRATKIIPQHFDDGQDGYRFVWKGTVKRG